ncbi:MAG: hypothetical protein HS099_08505 [Ardenticatenaceae bacterium]|nr:hypothetical protein [Ardenticatenaceae bacterium]
MTNTHFTPQLPAVVSRRHCAAGVAFGPQYWTGRLVSFVGTLITAVAISYGVQRHIRRWWLAALVGLAFLASNYVYHVGRCSGSTCSW